MKNCKAAFIFLLLIALSNLLDAQQLSPLDTTVIGRNEDVGKYVSMRGFRMYYETYGEGEPVIFIHGNGGSINNFYFQNSFFSAKYKVIMADSRAQGKSLDYSDSISYEMMSDDINALLDSLHITSTYVVGWSDGGIIGLMLAIRHPEKVKKLAITGANLWPDTTAVETFPYKWAKSSYDSLRRLPKNKENKNATKLFRLLINEPHITLKQLHGINCPSLIISGDQEIIRPEHTVLIARSIPNSNLWIIPDSGHSTPVFSSEQFNKTVDDFFQKPFEKRTGFRTFE
ncbi:MAG: alpha/beta hydrolase [Bacteroidota bacterium]|nr:alpha/beta hydrolase [Bacteroidota bacterium]